MSEYSREARLSHPAKLTMPVGVHEATFRWGKSRTWLRPSKVWIEPRHEQGLALFPHYA
jgi:hypothetical protein